MAHHEIVADGPGERTACGNSGGNAAETGARPCLGPQRRPPGAARLSGGRNVLQSVGRVRGRKSHAAPTSVRGSEFLFVGARRPELRALARSIDDRPVDRSGASGPFGGEGRAAGSVVGAGSRDKAAPRIGRRDDGASISVRHRIGTRGRSESGGRRTKAKCSSSWMRWKMAMCSLETTSDDPAYRSAVEVYLAGRHGASLRDDAFWGSPAPDWAYGKLRKRAAEIASRHPSVSAADLSQAESVIAPQLEKIRRFAGTGDGRRSGTHYHGDHDWDRHCHLEPDLVGDPSGRADAARRRSGGRDPRRETDRPFAGCSSRIDNLVADDRVGHRGCLCITNCHRGHSPTRGVVGDRPNARAAGSRRIVDGDAPGAGSSGSPDRNMGGPSIT